MYDIQFEVLKLQNYKIGFLTLPVMGFINDKTIDTNLENGFYYFVSNFLHILLLLTISIVLT